MLLPATGGFQLRLRHCWPRHQHSPAIDGLLARCLPFLSLLVFWAVCNPFFEIDRSSLIYSARALADADPTGVGRDLMFVFDGQSGFTLFTPLFRELTVALGSSQATLLIGAAAVVTACIGAYTLATAMCCGRARTLAIVFAATLPACYGGYQIFSYAETAATPRPFAEALVFLGLAALLRRRTGLAMAAMALAALFHPIMALPGVLVAFFWIAIADRRWLILMLGITLAAFCVAKLGIAPFDRLTTVMDLEWRSVLVDRNPQLFPSLWPEGWHGRFAARIATIIVAATFATPPVRKLLLATTAVGIAGFTIAYVFDVEFPLVFLLQAQTWRAMWLVFALGTIAAAICVCELWPRSGHARIVLVLLSLSWVFANFDSSVIFAIAAVCFHFSLKPENEVLPPRLVAILVSAAIGLVVIGLVRIEFTIWTSFGGAPAEAVGEAQRTLAADWDYTPLAALGAVLCLAGWHPGKKTLAGVSLCGLVFLATSWDRRSDLNRYFDGRADVSELKRMLEGRPGEVLWIGGVREAWSWLARPQWISTIQGAGLVFSRDLALRYRDRARLAIEAGLATRGVLAPFAAPAASAGTSLDAAKVHAFCALADAPAWIVAPIDAAHPLARTPVSARWTAPVGKLESIVGPDGSTRWQKVADYEIVPCGSGEAVAVRR